VYRPPDNIKPKFLGRSNDEYQRFNVKAKGISDTNDQFASATRVIA
jgi:hypothetical protein